MSTIVLGTGARGELVSRLQRQLVPFGLPATSVDGVFGAQTKDALTLYQTSHGLPPSGDADPATWIALVESSVPGVDERALGVTAAFEGHGYTLAQGNFDGAGITWGIIGFTLANGELKSLLTTIE